MCSRCVSRYNKLNPHLNKACYENSLKALSNKTPIGTKRKGLCRLNISQQDNTRKMVGHKTEFYPFFILTNFLYYEAMYFELSKFLLPA
jgi:hypothetical protein